MLTLLLILRSLGLVVCIPVKSLSLCVSEYSHYLLSFARFLSPFLRTPHSFVTFLSPTDLTHIIYCFNFSVVLCFTFVRSFNKLNLNRIGTCCQLKPNSFVPKYIFQKIGCWFKCKNVAVISQ